MLVRLASSHRRLISLPRHRSRQVHRTLPGGVCKLTSLALWVAYHHSGAANHSTSMQKRQNGQPHSTTLARGSHTPRYWRSFWSAPVFSGAFQIVICPLLILSLRLASFLQPKTATFFC